MAAEGQMLLYLGFRVPVVLDCRTFREAENAVKKLEEELGGETVTLSFQ